VVYVKIPLRLTQGSEVEMSHIEAAVRGSKKIEAVLRDGFGAEGRGLHEYLGCVEHRIPSDIVRKARFIASVRNKVVHQEEEIFDIEDFNRSVDGVVFNLNKVLEKERLQREAQQRIQREAHAQHQSCSPNQEITRESSGGMGRHFFMAIAIVLALYFWGQLQAEKDSRVQDARKHSQQLADLQQQLASMQKDKVMTPTKPMETRPELTNTSASSQNAFAERAALEPLGLKEVQLRLNKLGYVAGIPDGLPGPTTDSAIRNFESRNNLVVDGKLTASEHDLLMSGKAVGAARTTISKQGSLLAKARSSDSEYDQARRDISNELVSMLRKKTKVTLGNADVAQDASGTYSVRVPVSWSISGRKVLSLLNRYFNSYGGRPLALTSEHMISNNNRIVVNKGPVESSSAIKPYSGRLFNELQKIEIYIEVLLGRRKAKLVIAGNANCFVSCSYVEGKGDSWIVQVNGKPGESTINWKQETPVVIKGLTESELQNGGLPVAVIQLRVARSN